METKSLKKEQKLEAESAKKALKSAKAELGSRKEANSFRGSICWHWKAEGKCPYGDDCRFSHETEPNKKKTNAPAPARVGQDKKWLVCFKWRDTGDCRVKDCKFSHEMSPCNVCTMRTHRTKDCPQADSGEGETGDADEGGSSSDDSDEDLVAMMMRATCQDGQVRQKRATKEKTEMPRQTALGTKGAGDFPS